MSDFNDPNRFDKYGNPLPGGPGRAYDPDASTGRAPYVLLGILVVIGIVGGALYFNGTPNGAHRAPDVASAPGISRPMNPTPMPAAPRAPNTDATITTSPAPAAPATTPMAPSTPSQQ